MSQANIPNITPEISIDRDDVINLLLASIAFEELGLAHIINVEGEKIQYALGTLIPSPEAICELEDLIDINESVQSTLEMILKKELLLQTKLKNIMDIIE
ncbi:hypothetical protein [Oceanobacillus neutriphilus]|uniref:Uncharacterized protein n=1 Tax=Oceanobacillus neutriphilus TaxID=531815 RepID=A0ABQ2NQF0_9BACI|nr:hypothetical protein [Oceanobacillus neutriphilus]GGP09223.1 hypothetical protein GCM10011346_12430 [Oceanobacillus neutriphilus]